MIDFIVNNINVLEIFARIYENADCSLLGRGLQEILDEVFTWIQIAVPCLVFVLCSVDMAQAVISQEPKSVEAARSKSIKRIFIGVAIFFTPTLLNILFLIAGMATGTCGIGG